MASKIALKAEDISVVFKSGAGRFVALEGVNLEIASGEFAAVMGPSGCGKTTLLYVLSGILRPARGRVWVDGTEITALTDPRRTRLRRDRIGMVFQKFNLLPTLSARENVAIMKKLGAPVGAASLEELLSTVGLGDKRNNLPSELSMGEEQRVAIARALYTDPAVILADEPTGSVDSTSKAHILDVFEGCNAENGATILIATHDAEVAGRANRVVEMRDGEIV
jgi:putative ABC transport system ATP-binding protein